MKTLITIVVLGAVLAGCAARMTQAELEQDPRDSLTAQRDGFPKMYARAGTTVGAMRQDYRLCAAASPNMQKYAALHQPGAGPAGWLAEGLRDTATLGTHSAGLLREGRLETAACMKAKGYSRQE